MLVARGLNAYGGTQSRSLITALSSIPVHANPFTFSYSTSHPEFEVVSPEDIQQLTQPTTKSKSKYKNNSSSKSKNTKDKDSKPTNKTTTPNKPVNQTNKFQRSSTKTSSPNKEKKSKVLPSDDSAYLDQFPSWELEATPDSSSLPSPSSPPPQTSTQTTVSQPTTSPKTLPKETSTSRQSPQKSQPPNSRQQPKPPRSPFPRKLQSSQPVAQLHTAIQAEVEPQQPALPDSSEAAKAEIEPEVAVAVVEVETEVQVVAGADVVEAVADVDVDADADETGADVDADVDVDVEIDPDAEFIVEAEAEATEELQASESGMETDVEASAEESGESTIEEDPPMIVKKKSNKSKQSTGAITQSTEGEETVEKKPKRSKASAQAKAQARARSKKKESDDETDIPAPRTRSKKKPDVNEVADDVDLDPSLLIPEQEHVIKTIVDEGKNVFFTGSAGTGKSFVLKHMVQRLRKKYPKGVYMTAATGIAAVNIGGITLHSFAGIRLGKGSVESLAEQVKKSKKYQRRWKQCRVLIIDEISMIDNHLFDKLDKVARIVRENQYPFGGIQLVLCGDFFQLPPVKGGYIFEGEAWRECIDICIELTTVMRQKDTKFVTILNELRRGMMTDTSMLELRKCCRPLDLSDGIHPTKLYATNAAVDEENNTALRALPSESYFFEAVDKGPEQLVNLLKKDCSAAYNIELKVGAQVVLLRKVESLDGLCNGSRGVVIGFVDAGAKKGKFAPWYEHNKMLPVIRFIDGKEAAVPPIEFEVWQEERAVRYQLPLKLAWALTIHRAQGMTLDKAECKLSEAFAPGQAYVALSRVRLLEGLYLKDFDRRAIKVSHKVLTFYKKMTKDKIYTTGASPIPVPSIAATKADIRRSNTGSIRSFSLEKGMLVNPTGQRILRPSAPKPIGPSNATKIQTIPKAMASSSSNSKPITSPAQAGIRSSSTVTTQQAISGAFVNGSSVTSGIIAVQKTITKTTPSPDTLHPDIDTPDSNQPDETVEAPTTETYLEESVTTTAVEYEYQPPVGDNPLAQYEYELPPQDESPQDEYSSQSEFEQYPPQEESQGYQDYHQQANLNDQLDSSAYMRTVYTPPQNGHGQNGQNGHSHSQNGHTQNGQALPKAQNTRVQNGHVQNGASNHKSYANGHANGYKSNGYKPNGFKPNFKANYRPKPKEPEGHEGENSYGGSTAGGSVLDYLKTLKPKAKM